MKHITIYFLFLTTLFSAHAQDVAVNFKNLEDAKKDPDQVEWLTLRDNGLKQFPMEILEFNNLKYLDLSENDISVLPKEIGKLDHLFYLDLSGNHITTLPNEFSNIKTLRNLYLGYNGSLNLNHDIEVLSKLGSSGKPEEYQ